MITPAIKDKLLRYLIAQEQIDLEIDFHDLYEQTGIRFDLANMILEHFDRPKKKKANNSMYNL